MTIDQIKEIQQMPTIDYTPQELVDIKKLYDQLEIQTTKQMIEVGKKWQQINDQLENRLNYPKRKSSASQQCFSAKQLNSKSIQEILELS